MPQYTIQQLSAVWGWSGEPGASPVTWVRILDYKVSTLRYSDQFPIAHGGGVTIDQTNGLASMSVAEIQNIEEFLNGEPMNLMLKVSGTGALLFNWSELIPLDPDDVKIMTNEFDPVLGTEPEDNKTKG